MGGQQSGYEQKTQNRDGQKRTGKGPNSNQQSHSNHVGGEEREHILQTLFQTYLTTVDDYQSLTAQPFYEVGSTTPTHPTQPDLTTKLYDIRVREALQLIVRDPYSEF